MTGATWLTSNDEYADIGKFYQYFNSLYWTILISYGNSFAYNNIERFFGLFIMLCGSFLMTYSISVVGGIIAGMDKTNQ